MDNNTNFFHIKTTTRKKARNNIDVIQDQHGIWIQGREEIAQHYTSHFKDTSTTKVSILDESLFMAIPTVVTAEDNAAFCRYLDTQEILNYLKSMENWSAPSLEGFQTGFYKFQWETVRGYVCKMVQRFFQSKHILKQINKTYIFLIPKKKKAITAADYRSVGLCNTSHKIISKILVSRMKPLMEKIISPYQAAYVQGGCSSLHKKSFIL